MARGRKKKEDNKKGYFYDKEETAVINYLVEEDSLIKNKIFNEELLPAFTKMIESIIRRYKLYLPDEMFDETFNDTISFLMTKINYFNPNSGYKAYSYCGTVCKNYLIWKINQHNKFRDKNASYDEIKNELINDIKYSSDKHSSKISALNEIINSIKENIINMVNNDAKFKLTQNELKVGKALITIMDDWDELFARMGSNKFNKSSILLYLQETTLLNTNEIRDAMKKYKLLYQDIKKHISLDNYF